MPQQGNQSSSLPAGYTLDAQPQQQSGLPAGYTLDAPSQPTNQTKNLRYSVPGAGVQDVEQGSQAERDILAKGAKPVPTRSGRQVGYNAPTTIGPETPQQFQARQKAQGADFRNAMGETGAGLVGGIAPQLLPEVGPGAGLMMRLLGYGSQIGTAGVGAGAGTLLGRGELPTREGLFQAGKNTEGAAVSAAVLGAIPFLGGELSEEGVLNKLFVDKQIPGGKAPFQKIKYVPAQEVETGSTPAPYQKIKIVPEEQGSAPYQQFSVEMKERTPLTPKSQKLVLTPSEAGSEKKLQEIATQRASQRGMQYAGGMRPTPGKIQFNPTNNTSTPNLVPTVVPGEKDLAPYTTPAHVEPGDLSSKFYPNYQTVPAHVEPGPLSLRNYPGYIEKAPLSQYLPFLKGAAGAGSVAGLWKYGPFLKQLFMQAANP